MASRRLRADGTTSIRPNATATRAEFATALFNYMGFETDGVFAPDESIARGQIVTILCHTFKLKSLSDSFEYSDNGSVPEWAVTSVFAVRKAGWMAGDEDGTFRLKDTATRAEIATIFSRLEGEYQR